MRHCPLKEVTPEEWEADGFVGQENLLNGMRAFYPTLTLDSWVTIVRWDNARGKLVDDYRQGRAS